MPPTIPQGVPLWQADDQANECFICHSKFTLFFRRHHCRKCGRVVCGRCSQARSTYLPSTYVVSPPSQIFLESPHVPHRTCDVCMEELEMVRAALRGGRNRSRRSDSAYVSSSASASHHGPRRGSRSSTRKYDETLIQSVPLTEEDESNRCPICGKLFGDLAAEQREAHISQCIQDAEFSGSPDVRRRHNRMIVDTIPEKASNDNLGECVICLEEYEPGDRIGRLECLCFFHERCILDWFTRKGPGSCPVHSVEGY